MWVLEICAYVDWEGSNDEIIGLFKNKEKMLEKAEYFVNNVCDYWKDVSDDKRQIYSWETTETSFDKLILIGYFVHMGLHNKRIEEQKEYWEKR